MGMEGQTGGEMGTLVLGIATIGYVVGLVNGILLGIKLTMWVLRTRIQQHGLNLDLSQILKKPVKWNKRVGGTTQVGSTTWTNSGLATCARTIAPPGWYCTRQQGHEGPCAAERRI
jgi:hypothetical protein